MSELIEELDALVAETGNSKNHIDYRMQQANVLASRVMANWPKLRAALKGASDERV